MTVPKYQLIKDDLLKEILQGDYSSGDKFYSELELKEKYNVSSITVIRAIKELVKEGYLTRYQGKGTFISRKWVNKLVRLTDKEKISADKEKVYVLSMAKKNNPEILKELKLKKEDFYYKIIRVRLAEQIPYIFHISYIPEKYIIHPENPKAYESIYHQLRNDFNLNLNDLPSIQTNKICFPTNANIAHSLHLGTNEPTALLTRKTKRTLTNEIVEYIITYERWDYYQIKIENVQNN